MDPISVGVTAASVVKLSVKAVKDLWDVWEYYQSIKQVNQTVHDLYSGLKQVTNICNLVEKQIASLPQDESSSQDNEDLLAEIETQLSSCAAAIHRINSKLKRVREDKSNFVKQAARRVYLDMSDKDINELKDQVQACILNLQLSVQLVNLQATYIAPKLANRTLLEKLDEIQKLLIAQGVDKGMQDCADTYLTRGTTLYERSVASSVGGFYTQSQPKAIAEWLQALKMTEPTDPIFTAQEDDIISRQSTSQLTEETGPTLVNDLRSTSVQSPAIEEEADDDEDEFAIEMVQTSLASGRSFYAANDYKEAEVRLGECLALMQRLSEHHRRGYDFDEIHLLLSICAFHLHDLATAEAALLSALERNTGSVAHATLQFEAGAALAMVYVRLKKYDLAALNCENVYRGRRKLFGKEHESCYELLALLAQIHDLQGTPARADTYRSMIPSDHYAAIAFKYRELTQEDIVDATTEDIVPTSTHLKEWACKLKVAPSSYEISAEAMTLAYALPNGGSPNSSIILLDLQDGNAKKVMWVFDATAATCLAFNSNGKILASGHGGMWRKKTFRWQFKMLSVRVWNVSKGQLIHWFAERYGDRGDLWMNSLAFTPQDDRIVSTYTWHEKGSKTYGDLQPGQAILDATTGDVVHQMPSENCKWLDFSHDGTLVAFKNHDHITVSSLEDYSKVSAFEGHVNGRFDADNAIVGTMKDGTTMRFGQGPDQEMWLSKFRPPNKQNLVIDYGRVAFTHDNTIIAIGQAAGSSIQYLRAPQLGLWREIKETNAITGDWRLTRHGEYAAYMQNIGETYYLKVLDIQAQLKLADKIECAEAFS